MTHSWVAEVLFAAIVCVVFIPSYADAAHARHLQVPIPPGIECRTLIRFYPHGGVVTAIADELGRATTSIRAALYGLNHPDLVAAQARRGFSGSETRQAPGTEAEWGKIEIRAP